MGTIVLGVVQVTGTAFDEYLELVEDLHSEDKAEVESLRQQAVGYVWGWQDSGGDWYTTDDSWHFGLAYGTHAARYERHDIPFRLPVRDAWDRWRKGEPIER